MKTGRLNDILNAISCSVVFADTAIEPELRRCGNPACGGEIDAAWEAIRDCDIRIQIDLGKTCYVDSVVATFGHATALRSVTLRDGVKALSYHQAETGKTISSDEISLVADVFTDRLFLDVCCDFSDLQLLNVDIYGQAEQFETLFPTPAKVELTGKILPAALFASCSADTEEGLGAARIFAEKFEEVTGVPVRIGTVGSVSINCDPALAADAYVLRITADGAQILASNLRGYVCGVECFIKLTDRKGVQEAFIDDAPAYPFRGVHILMPSIENVAFTKRLVKYILSPMGYNTVVMEVAFGMEFSSHPQINAAVAHAVQMAKEGKWPPFPHGVVADGKALPQDAVRELVTYIKSFGIDVIPEVQSLGHVQFMTHTYPEIAEIPEKAEIKAIDTRDEDSRPAEFYPHCYCPSNERSYEVLFDLLDEIIAVFEPKEYVHMGHDEVYEIGVCPVCKTKSPAELFAQDVNRIHDRLAEKGLKMMIWSDMLQPVTKYLTPAAVDMIPKDILMQDFIWYFHLDKDIEDNLLNKGFQVIIGNLYSSHYPRFEKRIRKPGMLGGQTAFWVKTDEASLQAEGKFYDLMMTAQMLWYDGYSHHLNRYYDRLISGKMPQLREQIKQLSYPSKQEGAATVTLMESTDDLLSVKQDWCDGFIVEEKLASVVFYHTALRRFTRSPWEPNQLAGNYRLFYSDGSEELVPITYGGNVGYWKRRHNQPLPHNFHRHSGYTCCYETDEQRLYTAAGDAVTLYRYEHVLPADKLLARVALEQNDKMDAKIVLYRAEGIICRGK